MSSSDTDESEDESPRKRAKVDASPSLSDVGFGFEKTEPLAKPFAVGSSSTIQHQDNYSMVSQRIMVRMSSSFGDAYVNKLLTRV